MTTAVCICDDSSTARKQIARALPEHWDISLSFALNGRDALNAVRAGRAEVLFLDLTMPVMDGYRTLELIAQARLSADVIVVSGDVQPEARRRVLALGAREFLKKPVEPARLRETLERLGRLDTAKTAPVAKAAPVDGGSDLDTLDALQEVVNVAVGQATALLARLLDVFVAMPSPRVVVLEPGDLRMALGARRRFASVSTVCQGFIGAGIAGEALLTFNDASFPHIAGLMKFQGEIDRTAELELLMEIANVLVGASLNGISTQLDVPFSLGHPAVIGQHVEAPDLPAAAGARWKKTLAVELGYEIEDFRIKSDLLLVFTEDSIDPLTRRLECVFS